MPCEQDLPGLEVPLQQAVTSIPRCGLQRDSFGADDFRGENSYWHAETAGERTAMRRPLAGVGMNAVIDVDGTHAHMQTGKRSQKYGRINAAAQRNTQRRFGISRDESGEPLGQPLRGKTAPRPGFTVSFR